MKIIYDLKEVYHLFDTLVVDQFGCIHDGQRAYPDALAKIREISNNKKKIVVVSNSGSSVRKNSDRLENLGFPISEFNCVITSGEMLRIAFEDRKKYLPMMGGTNCYFVGRHDVEGFLLNLGIDFTEDIRKSDFVLLTGIKEGQEKMENFTEILEVALERKLPVICSNPDFQMVVGNEFRMASGAIGRKYGEMGGEVVFIGKPYPFIYEYLKDKVSINQGLCIGDSLEHDIMGGKNAGLTTCLVLTGLAEVFINESEEKIMKAVTLEANKLQTPKPDYILHKW